MTPAPNSVLAKELAKYHEMLPQWINQEGQFVVILGTNILGFFNDYGDALSVGYKAAGVSTPFLVKRVLQHEPPVHIRGWVHGTFVLGI